MLIADFTRWAFSSVLLSLRLTPALAFAPPFSLTPIPVVARVLVALGVSASLVLGRPDFAPRSFDPGDLLVASGHELLVGSIFMIALQLMFAALYVAGRVVDIQAGFGFAVLIDPTSRSSTPLIGTVFAFAAGAVFFALGGQDDLLRILAVSMDIAPIGEARFPGRPFAIFAEASVMFSLAMGVVASVVLCLFITDVAIAQLSRTVPQMNVLVLGFQAKVLIMLVVLPTTLSVSAVLMARMARVTLEALPGLL